VADALERVGVRVVVALVRDEVELLDPAVLVALVALVALLELCFAEVGLTGITGAAAAGTTT
jgi:hypothetical protein